MMAGGPAVISLRAKLQHQQLPEYVRIGNVACDGCGASPISFGFHAALYESEHSIVQLDVCSACRRKWERAAFGRTCAIQPWNDRFSDFKLVEFEPEARCPPVALTRSQLSPVHVELAVPLSESKPSRGFRGRQAKMQQHSHSLPEYVVQGHVVCDGCGLNPLENGVHLICRSANAVSTPNVDFCHACFAAHKQGTLQLAVLIEFLRSLQNSELATAIVPVEFIVAPESPEVPAEVPVTEPAAAVVLPSIPIVTNDSQPIEEEFEMAKELPIRKRAVRAEQRHLLPTYVRRGGVMCDGCEKAIVSGVHISCIVLANNPSTSRNAALNKPPPDVDLCFNCYHAFVRRTLPMQQLRDWSQLQGGRNGALTFVEFEPDPNSPRKNQQHGSRPPSSGRNSSNSSYRALGQVRFPQDDEEVHRRLTNFISARSSAAYSSLASVEAVLIRADSTVKIASTAETPTTTMLRNRGRVASPEMLDFTTTPPAMSPEQVTVSHKPVFSKVNHRPTNNDNAWLGGGLISWLFPPSVTSILHSNMDDASPEKSPIRTREEPELNAHTLSAICQRPKRATHAAERHLLPEYIIYGGIKCDGCHKMDILHGFHFVTGAAIPDSQNVDLCVDCRNRHQNGLLLLPQLSQMLMQAAALDEFSTGPVFVEFEPDAEATI